MTSVDKLKNLKISRGFTLLEVMVSLVIVALALTVLVKGAAENVNNANFLRDKTFAQWVAVNKVTEWRVQNFFLTRELKGDTFMGGQEWFWVAKAQKTENSKNRQKIEVSVYTEEQKEANENPTVRLTAYLMRL